MDCITHPASGNSIFEQLDNIIALHTLTLETFGPSRKSSLGQALLHARKTKGESQGQFLLVDIIFLHEVSQALSNVVEKLNSKLYEQNLIRTILYKVLILRLSKSGNL